MATAKKAVKKVGKKTGTAMAKWDEELARRAQIAVATAESSSHGGAKQIKTSGGRLQVDGAEVPGNRMNVIILDHAIEHALYGGSYDPDDPQPPIAWAIGRDEAELRWDEKSIEELDGEPIAGELTKDSTCNQFGSAEKGRGKAAKNIQRLMVITEGDLEDIANAEVRMLKVPVTSVKAWNGYVRQINEMFNRPPLGVVTEISLVPDPKSQFKMQFKLVEELDGEYFEELFPKADSVEGDLFRGYEPREEEEEERPARGRKPQKPVRGAPPAQRRNAPVVPAKAAKKQQGKAAPARAEAPAPKAKKGAAAPATKAAGKRKF